MILDPWTDAAQIAGRLQQPGSRLVVAIAAESWCAKCRQQRPLFDATARNARSDETFLWLDLEDHAEFVGDYLPDDLPMLLVYQDAELITHQVLRLDTASLAAHDTLQAHPADPHIWLQLAVNNWASEHHEAPTLAFP